MRIVQLLLGVALLGAACTPIQPNPPANSAVAHRTPPAAQTATVVAAPTATLPADAGIILEPEGDIQQIHDPVMTKAGDTYYVFSTGSRLIIHCSKDRIHWTWCGRVFERNPSWVADAIPGVGDLWAPDISFFAGKWHLYYSASTFGKNRSLIGLVTNLTLDAQSPDYQ